MPEITFERFARDCDYNKDEGRAPRELINDFKVIIDGEHRATLWRLVYGRGYRLNDIDDRPIYSRPQERWSHIHISSQREFKSEILRYIAFIPDAQTLEETRAKEAAERDRVEAEHKAARRYHRLCEAGERMLGILRILQKDGARVMSAEVRRAPLLAQVNEIITEIETDVPPEPR